MKQKLALGTCLMGLILTSAQSNAADVAASVMPTGTLSIRGKILDKGCTFEAKDMIIQLAPVQLSKFTAAGDMGPKSDAVNFNLTGCPSNSTLTFTVAGTAGTNTSAFAITPGTSVATGFEILLYGPTASAAVNPNTAQTLTTDSSGNYSGSLIAQITTNSATRTVGKVDTTLTYTLAYN